MRRSVLRGRVLCATIPVGLRRTVLMRIPVRFAMRRWPAVLRVRIAPCFATRIRSVVRSHRRWSRFRPVIAPQIAIVGTVIVSDVPVVGPVVVPVAMLVTRGYHVVPVELSRSAGSGNRRTSVILGSSQ